MPHKLNAKGRRHIPLARSGRGETGGMIIPSGPLKVMVATKPVDFRKGAIGLAARVEHELGLKPFCGVAYIFRSRPANRIKLVVWDGTGLVLVSKVLQTESFHWPRAGDGVMRLSAGQASALFEGVDRRPNGGLIPPALDIDLCP